MRHNSGSRRRELGRRSSLFFPLAEVGRRYWRRCLSGTLLVWSVSAGAVMSADPENSPPAATETTRAAPPLRREAALHPTVPPPWPVELPPIPPSTTPDSPRDAVDDWQQAKERQFQRLQQQILELGRRWNGRRELTGVAPESRGAESLPISDGAEPATAPNNDPSSTPPSQLPPVDQSASSPSALPLEGPIDRLGLADSLFATGQIAAAVRVYSELDAAPLTPDERGWIHFQLAACDRRLGRISTAQQRYRDLLTTGRPDWLMPLARWWLKAIDDRERLAANAAKLKTVVQQLEIEVTRELQPDSGPTVGADPASRR